MWPWQQKKLGKNSQTPEQLLWRVLQISVIGHLLVLLLFLFGGRSSVLHVSMRAFPNNARIVCVPSFMLPSCKNKYAGKRGSATRASGQASSASMHAVPQKTVSHETTALVHAKQKKLSPRELRRERLHARKLERENKRKQARELATRKRIEEREAKQREADLKREAEQHAAEQRLAQQHIAEQRVAEVDHSAEETSQAPESAAGLEPIGDGESDETVIYVDSATYQMTEMMKELQQALQQVWEQPAGCAVGYACEISVTVSGDGKASAVVVRKKSGAAVYDMAARRAATAALYPKLVYNRTIVIHFGE